MFSTVQGQSGVVAGGGLLPFMVGGGQAVGGRPMSGVDSYQGAQVLPIWASSGGNGLGGGIFCAGIGGGAGLGGAGGGGDGSGPKRGEWRQVTDFSVLREVMSGSRSVRRIESIPESGPQRDAIVQAVEAATKSVLIPRPDNFTPPSRTPWGGTKIRELMGLAEGDIVGEAWAVSGHPSFPNRFIFAHDGEYIEIPFTLIGELFPGALYGPSNVAHFGNVPPFLTKLLDARENLSIQVHPTVAYAATRPEKNWHSKTEMWVILDVEEGAGLYLGLKEGVTREEFAAAVENGDDVSKFLNFVPVKSGDVYFIPAGTPHAIGAGVFLAEHQETSETTFRLYSWGDGRELHKKDGVAAIDFDAPRGEALVQSLRRTPSRVGGGDRGQALHENFAVESEFSFDRVSFPKGALTEFIADASQGMHGITVIEGVVRLSLNEGLITFEKGDSFIIPAAAGKYRLVSVGNEKAVVFIGRSDPRDIVRVEDLMKTSGVKFGTSGARGLATDMTDAVSFAYTQAFLAHLEQVGDILLGDGVAIAGDLRPSTDRIMRAVATAIKTRGYHVVNLGKIPTPAMALYAVGRGIPSVMVTGSHIPDDRNGIKYYRSDGEVLKTDEAGMMRQAPPAAAGLFDRNGMLDRRTLPDVESDARLEYIARYLNFFGRDSFRGLKIGLYEHSAVGRDMLGDVLEALGAEVIRFGRSDAFIPVDTEAVRPEDEELVRRFAAENSVDAIVSTDGDSDRPFFADESGEVARGDVLGALAAKILGAKVVVTPVSSNTMVDEIGFDEVSRVRIGSPYVIEAMRKLAAQGKGPVAAYEANGGFLLSSEIAGRFAPRGRLTPLETRDAFLPLLLVIAEAKAREQKMSELFGELPRRFTHSDRLKDFPVSESRKLLAYFSSGDHAEDLRRIRKHFAEYGEVRDINMTDGVRITFASGVIVHLRPSGNAPEFRTYVETDNADASKRIVANVLGILKSMAGMA